MPCCTEKYKLSHMTSSIKDSYRLQPETAHAPSEHKDNTGSLDRNISVINYIRDKDNVS